MQACAINMKFGENGISEYAFSLPVLYVVLDIRSAEASVPGHRIRAARHPGCRRTRPSSTRREALRDPYQALQDRQKQKGSL